MTSITYADAGVNIDAGNELVEKIKPLAKNTHNSHVLNGLGGFGALFELPQGEYKQPVLVSCTDGVGTKLRFAITHKQHNGVGIDLVAMCANDLIVQGAKPLFFLDYYASGKLDVDSAYQVVESIAKGCELSGMALVGGETAEMPGMYHDGDYDLAGFCVGIVEKDKLIDGRAIQPGDSLIALASSGVHSNGYSLIHKLLEKQAQAVDDIQVDGQCLIDTLLTPTRIYVKSCLALIEQVTVKGFAHITGGGLSENLPRVLPEGCQAVIDSGSWEWPEIFRWLQAQGNISAKEMYRTFNCGVGMVACVSKDSVDMALDVLRQHGEQAWIIGSVAPGETENVIFNS